MEIEQVYERYRELARTYAPPIGRILKTDCFNEGEDGFRSLGDALPMNRTTYLELDELRIDLAQAKYPECDFRKGDIRELPFESLAFAAVFDFSTIDHVPPGDVERVLFEYHRVLKLNAKLVLVVWCSEEQKDDYVDWGDGPQYFFQEADVVRAMMNWFDIYHRDVIHRGDGIYLVEFVARRK